jgi:hypothetical protein
MKISLDLDWDSVDNVTTENLLTHYRIVMAMIEDENRAMDLEYNTKLRDALKVVLDYFGIEV